MLERPQLPSQPVWEDLMAMWRRMDFPLDNQSYPKFTDYAALLRSLYTNGSVLTYSFVVPPDPVFDWYAGGDDLHAFRFFDEFWQAPTVRRAFASLNVPAGFSCEPKFTGESAFTFDGILAQILSFGGAYKSPQMTAGELKAFGRAVSDELIGQRYDEVLFYLNQGAWSKFFYYIAWDVSWVLLDKRRRRIHVLCGTDTD